MSLQTYWHILWRHRILIVGVTLLALAGSVGLAWLGPRSYESYVRIHVQPVPPVTQGSTFYSQEYYRQVLAEYSVDDFTELAESRVFAKDIINRVSEVYGLTLEENDILEAVRASRKQRVLKLAFTHPDKQTAYAMAAAAEWLVTTKASDYFASVREGLVSMSVVDPAEEARPPSLLRLGAEVLARTLVACMLLVGLVFLWEAVADQFHRSQEVEQALGLPVLASVPRFQQKHVPVPQGAHAPGTQEAVSAARTEAGP
jgi:capsular polysaccharide biosynthesis protein